MPDNEKVFQYLEFIQKAEQLKSTLRSAHTAAGRRESTAEHSWRLALLAMVLEDEYPELDQHRVLKLCLVHDLGEAIGGDIPAINQVPGQDKAGAERADLLTLAACLPEKRRTEIIALWDEYENAATPEARLVKGLDKLETIIQHNQGLNPPDFNYRFNLEYGREHMSAHPLLAEIRRIADDATALKANERLVDVSGNHLTKK